MNCALRVNPAFYKEKQLAELSLCVADGMELVHSMQGPLHTHPYKKCSVLMHQLQGRGRDKFRVTYLVGEKRTTRATSLDFIN